MGTQYQSVLKAVRYTASILFISNSMQRALRWKEKGGGITRWYKLAQVPNDAVGGDEEENVGTPGGPLNEIGVVLAVRGSTCRWLGLSDLEGRV